MKPLVRYLLYQVPGWALAAVVLGALMEWIRLPWVAALGALAIMVLKDLALYPVMRRSYEPAPYGVAQLVGEEAVVVETLAPSGYVRIRGELWHAEAADSGTIPAGSKVRVRAVRDMTLLVIRCPDTEAAPAET